MQTVNKDSNDFGEIRRRGYVYVDKTAWFHRLATAEGEKMFFQTGYLTILDYNKKTKRLTLGIPNAEVREDFSSWRRGECKIESVKCKVNRTNRSQR